MARLNNMGPVIMLLDGILYHLVDCAHTKKIIMVDYGSFNFLLKYDGLLSCLMNDAVAIYFEITNSLYTKYY